MRQSKPVSDSFEGKDLCEDWGTIQDGYGDLLQDLQPDNPDSEVDKVVKFILNQNIPIRYVEIKYNHLTSRTCHVKADELQKLAKANPKLKFVRFRPGKGGEGEIIKKNWYQLMKKANVRDREKCYNDIFVAKFGLNLARTRNVVGCYLGQGLPYIRISASIVNYAKDVLGPWNKGDFTKEDDETIIAEVNKNGENAQTWNDLAKSLNRLRPGSIFTRYQVLKDLNRFTGRYSLNEDSIILEYLFEDVNDSHIDRIKTVTHEHLKPLVAVLRRNLKSISNHWQGQLKPILLSYHNGQLHFDWTVPFFKLLIAKQVVRSQDIVWPEILQEFPCQTKYLMAFFLTDALQMSHNQNDKPIYESLNEILQRWKDRHTKPSRAKYREDIVHLYDKIRGLSD